MKLHAFIGSSSENLNVANALRHNLKDVLDCQVWTDDFFKLSHTTIETLTTGIDKFDLGIFVFGKDDAVISRGVDSFGPRDNVIFEHGLFCGRLGSHRALVIRAKDRSLKWLSDLSGFTPAEFDENLALTNADKAIEDACTQIRSAISQIVPRPGLYRENERVAIGPGWWTYGSTEASATIADHEGIEIITEGNIGILFPRYNNLEWRGRFCAVRFKAAPNLADRRFYVSVRAESEKVLLAMSDSYDSEGWGNPRNEFMIRLPHLEEDRYQSIVLELDRLKPYVGKIDAVTGILIRPGMKVSHMCVCDELPDWLKRSQHLYPIGAPQITIEYPPHDGVVEREHIVEGTVNFGNSVAKANDLQVFVLADDIWYPQGRLTVANGRWKLKAYFGNVNSGPGEFAIAAITTGGKPTKGNVRELPLALGRAKIRVTRKS
ncbi:nucleotide-binding protein [Tunturiibacter psychrotolerans]|uniref:nucleotide-binding protein n=1 Tax=Tunturiibacter psychrotolerans TaxID=3069686 RepID=UPI003D23F67F